jgi:predicted nucleotide-binding protein
LIDQNKAILIVFCVIIRQTRIKEARVQNVGGVRMTDNNSNTPKQEPASTAEEKKRVRISQSDVPLYSLDEALKVPRAIIENYAGRPTTPLNVASALNMLPNSSSFRMLTGSAIAYGLTDSGYNSKEIAIQPLAKRIISPLAEGDDIVAKREAALKPRIIGEFLRKYDGSPLPRRDIALNVLTGMGIPKERVEDVYKMTHDTAQNVGLIREIRGKTFVDLSGVSAPAEQDNTSKETTEVEIPVTSDEIIEGNLPPAQTQKPTAQGIFIAHGKNKKPLDQLKKILDSFKVPYKVAVDEPNLGRPISIKVKQIMESCNCAILIFTADEQFFDKDNNPIWRPSENVIWELGASAYLYGNRIVILKEDGIQFATNFSDLGHISFAKDQLEAKSMDLIKELIGFDILKITT